MDIFKVSDLFSLFKKQLIANPKKKFLFHKKNDNWVGLNYLEIQNSAHYSDITGTDCDPN